MRTNMKHNDKLAEALELLNEAAKEKREELYELIGGKYSHFKEILTDTAENGRDFAKGKAKEIDEKVHENPWFYLGLATLGSMIVGFLLRKRSY